jgi:hypothetical protein
VQYLVVHVDCCSAMLSLFFVNVTSMTCFDRRKSSSGSWVYVTVTVYCFTWKYLCDDDPLGSKHVAEVTFTKKSDNIAQQQSMSMTRSCTFKTALANPITDQRNGMPECKTSLVYVLLLKWRTFFFSFFLGWGETESTWYVGH